MKRIILSAFALMAATAASAEEITLRAINGHQPGTHFSKDFEAFVAKVNEEGKGVVQINLVGGPEAIPTMEQGAAVSSGVVDMAHTTAAWTASLVPEGLAFNYATTPFSEQRQNGALDYMNEIYAQKNMYYFGRTGDLMNYHIYLAKPIEKADLTGLKVRIAPIFRSFFQELGADVVQIAPGEVYTALERGVVDGYGWPFQGVFDMGWQDVTKYRVDPGFYMLEMAVVFNKDSWAKLNDEQKAFLEKQRDWLETTAVQSSIDVVAKDLARQDEAGIKSITFSEEDTAAYLKKSQDAGWAGVIASSPEHGPKLRELMAP